MSNWKSAAVSWAKRERNFQPVARTPMKTGLLPDRTPTPEEEADQARRMEENQKWMREFLADWTPMEDDTGSQENTHTGGELT